MPSPALVEASTGDLLSRARGALHAVLARPLPPGSEAAMELVRPAVDTQVVYVSTPITTGPAYLDWLIAHREAPVSERDVAREAMVRANITAVVPLVRDIPGRFPGAHVIDPTALEDMPSWRQADYHRFWAEVILTMVDEIVFADGWAASVGCSVEFAVAMLQGVPAYRADFTVIKASDGLRELQSMVPRIYAAGASVEMHRAVAVSLNHDQR